MLLDELRKLLAELVAATGASSAATTHARPACGLATPLGNHAWLVIEHSGEIEGHADPVRDPQGALERSARAVRAALRRWDVAECPVLSVGRAIGPSRALIQERIGAYLQALANQQQATNVVVTRVSRVVASVGELSELEASQLEFLVRRAHAEAARKTGSSQAELIGDDYYVATFYFDACLVLFFAKPPAVDFVRHRVRMVARELSILLPLLDEPPPAPAMSSPIPD